MTVPFANIPANLRTPLFFAELSASQANTSNADQVALLIGQMTAAGAAVPGVPVLCTGVADARAKAGVGSILAAMVAAYAANDSVGSFYILPLADAAGAIAATGSIAFAGSPTATGTISLYIAAQLVTLPVTIGQTPASIATALAAQINLQSDLPVTAAVDGVTTSQVDLTAKNKGLATNDVDIRLNYLGSTGGQATPAGLVPTIVAMTGGATNPTLTTALAALGSQPFDFIVNSLNDPTSVAAISALLNDATGRWSFANQTFGHAFVAQRGTIGALATYGQALNDQHTSCMGVYDTPSPVWIVAAALAGAVAVSVRADPGTPVQTLPLASVLAPPLQSRFSLGLRNTLLYDGISTFTVDSANTVRLENIVTTYQKNALGQPDNSYLEIETMYLLMYILRALAGAVTSKFARVKLAADNTRFGAGANVVTPSVIRAEIIAQYGALEDAGMVQNSAAFAAALIVQQNATNPNRVDVLLPAILIDQLRVFAVLAQFRLQ